MSATDLFDGADDPVTKAAKLLAQKDVVAVPGALMRQCLTTLHVLACDAEDGDEADSYAKLIGDIEASIERITTSSVKANSRADSRSAAASGGCDDL